MGGETAHQRLQTVTGQPVARITGLTGCEHQPWRRLGIVREIRRRAIHLTRAGQGIRTERRAGRSGNMPLPSAGIRGPAGVHGAANGVALTGNGGGGTTGPPGGAVPG